MVIAMAGYTHVLKCWTINEGRQPCVKQLGECIRSAPLAPASQSHILQQQTLMVSFSYFTSSSSLATAT